MCSQTLQAGVSAWTRALGMGNGSHESLDSTWKHMHEDTSLQCLFSISFSLSVSLTL